MKLNHRNDLMDQELIDRALSQLRLEPVSKQAAETREQRQVQAA